MTTAAETQFAWYNLDGTDGRRLWIDGNQKISGWEPFPNAFSIVQVQDCPGATSICKASCYVHNIEKHATDVYNKYKHNSATIREILQPAGAAVDSPTQWARRLGTWIAQNCEDVGFRWHVSGDVFSMRYAQWIRSVCEASPNVRHWIYTRSFRFVPSLVGPENLTVNLSCDADNYHQARALWEVSEHPVRLCYLTHDGRVPKNLPADSVIFPDYAFRSETGQGQGWWNLLFPHEKKMVCPVDRLGKSETRRCGPCQKCIKEPV